MGRIPHTHTGVPDLSTRESRDWAETPGLYQYRPGVFQTVPDRPQVGETCAESESDQDTNQVRLIFVKVPLLLLLLLLLMFLFVE